MLIRGLPATSRLAVAVRGAEHEGWDVSAYLLAAAVDAINANTHALVQVNSTRKVRAPASVPRPGTRRARRVIRLADVPGAMSRTDQPRGTQTS